jgi:hypothetical protein
MVRPSALLTVPLRVHGERNTMFRRSFTTTRSNLKVNIGIHHSNGSKEASRIGYLQLLHSTGIKQYKGTQALQLIIVGCCVVHICINTVAGCCVASFQGHCASNTSMTTSYTILMVKLDPRSVFMRVITWYPLFMVRQWRRFCQTWLFPRSSMCK